MDQYKAIFLNDNRFAFGSEWICAPNRQEAEAAASARHPMGHCGLYKVYSEGEYAELQRQTKKEEEDYRRKVEAERYDDV